MATEPITPLSISLATPLNGAVRQANGGQFALLLSLLFENRWAASQQVEPEPLNTTATALIGGDLRLEAGLGYALAGGAQAQFRLLQSLVAERNQHRLAQAAPLVAEMPDDRPRRRAADQLLQEIEYGRGVRL